MHDPRWLLFVHHIPPQPNYLRVKVGRRLQALGAVAIKNSVYVLPRSDAGLEDLQWLRREIVAGKGAATICEARFLEGHSETDVEALFRVARADDYSALLVEARRLERSVSRRTKRHGSDSAAQPLSRLRSRLVEIERIDFFGAEGREVVEELLGAIEARLRPPAPEVAPEAAASAATYRGRTWVTRRGVQVDRIASAWLIQRFIDPGARFEFVLGHDHPSGPDEVRFDMAEAEFTHEGDLCTFEVLLRRFRLRQPALRQIGEIVHDVDLKDDKFGRPEASGVERLIRGIVMRQPLDEPRLSDGGLLFDSLYESLRRQG